MPSSAKPARPARAVKSAPPPIPSDWHIRSRLKTRHWLLLVALDDQRNMHRAAAAIAMTQPAATRLLADLERVLGVRLFERGARGVAPNLYGASLIRHARVILATMRHVREELAAIAEGAMGKIAVGVFISGAAVLVPRAVALFKRDNPWINVLLRDDPAGVLIDALRRGEIDLVVGRLASVEAAEGLAFESFYTEPMRLVVRAGHPLARRRRLDLAALHDGAWVFPTPEAAYRSLLDASFRQAGVEPPRNVVESRSVVSNLTLLRETDMIGVMPDGLARQYVALGILRQLLVALPPNTGPIGAITVPGRPAPPGTADLLQALRQVAQEQRREPGSRPKRQGSAR